MIGSRNIAPEHGLLVAHLIIGPPDTLDFVLIGDDAEKRLAAGIAGLRQILGGDGHCSGAEQIRIDLIIDGKSLRSREDLVGSLAGCGSVGTEVPREHGGGGYKTKIGRRRRARGGSLETSEEEQLVVDSWTADGTAELMPLQSIAGSCEEIAGIEYAVADKFKSIPVKAVGAGLRDCINRCTRMHSVLGRQSTGLNLELLQ